MAAFLLLMAGCGRDVRLPALPEGVSIESQIPEGVSWASLLRDAADLSTLTKSPSPFERSVLFSSSAETNKVCLANLAPEILGDLDHGFFYRVEDVEGFVEATLAEGTGAGAITWIWSANPIGQAVLYIDNTATPALQVPFASLLEGSFLPVQYPYAALTAHGYNLHFPIVHTNSFRLAVRVRDRKELSSLFYHVAWNALDPSKPIRAFDLQSVQASAPLLGSLAERFLAPAVSTTQCRSVEGEWALAPGTTNRFFQSSEPGVIRSLDLAAGNKSALSDLWLEARWDGQSRASVSCPLSMLAGTSSLGEDTASVPCTLKGERLSLRWPMPFGPGSILSLVNKGQRGHSVRSVVLLEPPDKEGNAPPLRFFANYERQESLSLTARNVVTLADLAGPGRIVGCALRVDSRCTKWWGEGDERIWLDRDDGPAWRGTGTEDYFGFAWCSDETFDHPLRGQTRADGSRSRRRVAAMHRYHLLDRLPFNRFARFEMEAWGLAEGYMDYETTVLWYGAGKNN